ncbi:MAG: lytic transglycosylase domain-containing protein [Acidobacteria bacterium]|nr:lytic transglycosylase domain-containing protein [Acidobacteriota bacterium]
MLENRLERRFVAGLVEKAASPLWEIPAKHLLRFEGTEGVLSAGEDRVVYKSDRLGDSRTWFFSDIDHISRSDLYELTITTYERARSHYGDRKDFNFRLKQPISEQQYDDLWRRIEKSKGLEVSAAGPATDPFLALHQSLEKAAGRPLWAAAGLQPGPASQGPARTLTLPAVPDPRRIIQVESQFNPRAISPKGARGLWQLTPGTARRFGLRVDAHDDERVDPARSTRAATRYLAYLHGLFGDWRLVLAAYNAGESRVLRAIEHGGTRDFYELSRRGLLPEETRRYVPAVLTEEKEKRQ